MATDESGDNDDDGDDDGAADDEEPSLPELPWEELRLEPKFDVVEKPASFELAAFLPGLVTDDVHIGLDELRCV